MRPKGKAHNQPDELESSRTSCSRTRVPYIVSPTASDQGEAHGRTGGKISRLRIGRSGAAFGIKLSVIGRARLNALESRIYRLGRSIGKYNFAESDAELSIAVQHTSRPHLEDRATKLSSGWKDEMPLID
jgi:hypothetical protein